MKLLEQLIIILLLVVYAHYEYNVLKLSDTVRQTKDDITTTHHLFHIQPPQYSILITHHNKVINIPSFSIHKDSICELTS